MSKFSSSSVNPVNLVIKASPKFKTGVDKFNAVEIIEGGLEDGLEAGLELDRDRGIIVLILRLPKCCQIFGGNFKSVPGIMKKARQALPLPMLHAPLVSPPVEQRRTMKK